MGYYVRALKEKKSGPQWKVQFVSNKKSDRRATSVAKEPKTTWDINKDRWQQLGFHSTLSLSEARSRARQLNSQLNIKRQEEAVCKLRDRTDAFQVRHESWLPSIFVAEFEERFIRARAVVSEAKRKQRNQQRFNRWRATQKMIVAIGLEPSRWFYHNEYFYDYIVQHRYSLGYGQTLISMANLWGNFISRKLAQPFSAVLRPRGYERQRIIEAYYEKTKGRRRPSLPITPQHLEQARNSLKAQNLNWITISVWFGLRPQEIDQLHDECMWRVEVLPTGRKILWVYQTKIVALPPEDRWKPIPILFDEQHFALKIILDQNFQRPLSKTVRKHFGDGHDLYGGRKGFVDLMLSRNQPLVSISIWMGHSHLARTWRSYKNKRVYHE